MLARTLLALTILQVVAGQDALGVDPVTLDFSSSDSHYHKIRNYSHHDYFYYAAECRGDSTYIKIELGDGWAPVILETEAEWDFIRATDIYVRENAYPRDNEWYWIGGSTSVHSVLQSDYSDYVPDSAYDGFIGMVVLKYPTYTKMRPYWREADHVWGILCEKGWSYNSILARRCKQAK